MLGKIPPCTGKLCEHNYSTYNKLKLKVMGNNFTLWLCISHPNKFFMEFKT